MARPNADSLSIQPAVTRLRSLRRLSRLLDNAIGIPGTRFRLGLDPILGLIPGGGDTAGLLLSSYIVLESARLGASKSILGQMVFNILLETVVGTVPVLGDIFDVTWKSNVRNIQLLEEHLQIARPYAAKNHAFAIFLLGLLFLAFIGCAVLSFFVLRAIVQWIHYRV